MLGLASSSFCAGKAGTRLSAAFMFLCRAGSARLAQEDAREPVHLVLQVEARPVQVGLHLVERFDRLSPCWSVVYWRNASWISGRVVDEIGTKGPTSADGYGSAREGLYRLNPGNRLSRTWCATALVKAVWYFSATSSTHNRVWRRFRGAPFLQSVIHLDFGVGLRGHLVASTVPEKATQALVG